MEKEAHKDFLILSLATCVLMERPFFKKCVSGSYSCKDKFEIMRGVTFLNLESGPLWASFEILTPALILCP